MTQAAYKLVEQLQDSIARAETEFHLAYWEAQVEATPSSERRRADKELALRRIKGDPQAHSAVLKALADGVHDPVLARQLELLRSSLTGNQMDDALREDLVTLSAEVESLFAAFRPVVGDRTLSSNDIEEILRTSHDESERRDVWLASKEVGQKAAPLVREMVRLRNRAAHDLGYADFYRMSLDLQELPEEWLFGLLDDIEAATDEPFRAWKSTLDADLRKRFGTQDLAPWHYSDPFFQSPPPTDAVDADSLIGHLDAVESSRKTFASWGIDLAEVIERSDLFPRAAKCEHAFCLDVDRTGKDIRLLCNVVPGARWIEVMLHECGHAAYDISIDGSLPYLLHRPAHIFVTEAIALLCGSLIHDGSWLVGVAGLDRSRVDAAMQALRAADAGQKLLFARWCLVMAHFERALYSDPEADLQAVWWDLVERFQGLGRPGVANGSDWAAKIHVAVAPVYYHNYLLGELLAAQLRGVLIAECGQVVPGEQAGQLLTQRVFRHGALIRWDALVEAATGRPLGAAEFVAGATSGI